jgi:hypothetical protein
VLGAPGETETTQENTLHWLELDVGDLGVQLLTEEEIAAVIFFYLFSSALPVLSNFLFIYFSAFLFLSFRAIFWSINPDYPLIRMIPPPPFDLD